MSKQLPVGRWDQPMAAKMSKRAGKLRTREFSLRRRALEIEQNKQLIELLKTIIQSPVWAGSIAFLGVHGLESAIKVSATAQGHKQITPGSPMVGVGNTADQRAGQTNTTPPGGPFNPFGQPASAFKGIDLGFLQEWAKALIGAYTGFIFTGGNVVGAGLGATGNVGNLFDLFKNLDFAALKLVILIYIASGGNLPGLLQQSSGVLGDMLKGLGLGSLAGAAAP